MRARELTRVEVLARVKAGALRVRSAAVLLQVGTVRRSGLVRRYRARCAKGLRHGSAGRRSNHARPTAERGRTQSRHPSGSSREDIAAGGNCGRDHGMEE